MAIYNPSFYLFGFKVLKFLNAILLFKLAVKPKVKGLRENMNGYRFTNKTSTSPEGRRPPRWTMGKNKK